MSFGSRALLAVVVATPFVVLHVSRALAPGTDEDHITVLIEEQFSDDPAAAAYFQELIPGRSSTEHTPPQQEAGEIDCEGFLSFIEEYNSYKALWCETQADYVTQCLLQPHYCLPPAHPDDQLPPSSCAALQDIMDVLQIIMDDYLESEEVMTACLSYLVTCEEWVNDYLCDDPPPQPPVPPPPMIPWWGVPFAH